MYKIIGFIGIYEFVRATLQAELTIGAHMTPTQLLIAASKVAFELGYKAGQSQLAVELEPIVAELVAEDRTLRGTLRQVLAGGFQVH